MAYGPGSGTRPRATAQRRGVGLGIVGAGRWGRNYVRTLARLPGATLRWVCDLDPAALRLASGLAPAARLTDALERVLADRGVQAVVIATDSGRHHRPALAALAAGKDVLVEKPMTLQLAASDALARLAASRQRLLMVGHLMLFHPAIQQLHQSIAKGRLGRVRYLRAERSSAGCRREAGGVLWSLGPHDLSIVDRLLSCRPVTLTARGLAGLDGQTEVASVSLAMADGGLADLHLSWVEPGKHRRLTVVGSRAVAVFDEEGPGAGRLLIHDVVGRSSTRQAASGALLSPPRVVALPRVEPLQSQCAHFVECVATRTEPLTSPSHALRVMRLLAASSRSLARAGEPVAIEAAGAAAGFRATA